MEGLATGQQLRVPVRMSLPPWWAPVPAQCHHRPRLQHLVRPPPKITHPHPHTPKPPPRGGGWLFCRGDADAAGRSVCRQQRWHCGRAECAGTCAATGDPHYVTFDGRAFTFPGDCEYLLAREASGLFAVTAENVPCGSTGVTCTKSVVVVMGNTVVHMLRGEGRRRGCGDVGLGGSPS